MLSRKHAIDVLRYWALVEELTPPELEKDKPGKGKSIQHEVFSDKNIPWLQKERFQTHKSTPRHKWEYTVFLGINKIKTLLGAIKNIFGDARDGYSDQGDKFTCILAFKIDVNGRPLSDSLEIPDYIVAMGCAMQCDPPSLAGIDHDSKGVMREKIKDVYRNFCDEFDQKDRIQPVDFALLHDFLEDILEIVGWYKMVKSGSTSIQNTITACGKKIPLSKKSREKEFFNSFLLKDINAVIRQWQKDPTEINRTLYQYLGLAPLEQRQDLADRRVLRKYTSMQLMAPARWPGAGDHTLSISQQVAVNLALSQESGIFSVNGPPGTGKTTLLNDIISNIIVRRAQAMASLVDPVDAFEAPIKEQIHGEPYAVWKPKALLQGYEIVIAGSNNTAVENISREIPGQGAVSPEWKLDYFADLAKHILDIPDCWGLCAAPLGRQDLVNKFFNNFWKKVHDEAAPGFNDWLLQCQGNKAKTQVAWMQAKQEFQSTLKAYNAVRQQLIEAEQDLDQLYQTTQQLQDAKQQLAAYKQQLAELKTAQQALETPGILLKEKHKDCTEQLRHWHSKKPSWWTYLIPDEAAESWAEGYNKALDAQEAAWSKVETWQQEVATIQDKLQDIARAQHVLTRKCEDLQACIDKQAKYIELYKVQMGCQIPDYAFWQQPEEALQQSTPWYSKELHRLRAMLFVKAMNLHRAFIAQAAIPLYDNLSSINALVANKKNWSKKEANVLPALWTSLCTVVPVLSTTFASIGNLKGLGKEDIGWLLIDEAGQAAPQAAVGVLQRAKHVVVVGDPLQIRPIVNIPESMSQCLREHYQLDSTWDVHSTSVQQLADQANAFGTHIGRTQHLWIGAPLRVHRRCQSPMFEIANQIAYQGLMVQATPAKTSALVQQMQQHGWPRGSQWLQVKGRLSDTKHWILEEGEVALKLLARICRIHQQLPNVYVITPFKGIVTNLRSLFREHIAHWAPQGTPHKQADNWVGQSVGTIHTFQGKQADGIILVLGGSADNLGAVRWAAGAPNILNVALTRARYFCLIVGNYDLWSQQGYFSKLARHVEVSTPEAYRAMTG